MGLVCRFQPFGGRHPRYHAGDVLFESNQPQTKDIEVLSNAIYEVAVIGAGGGGGGGTYGSHHKHPGGGGGSGAGFVAVMRLQPGTYQLTVGAGGAGGKQTNSSAPAGSSGTASLLVFGDDALVSAGGGEGGAGAQNGRYTNGGTLTLGDNLEIKETKVSADGNDVEHVDIATGGAAVYETYGAGGNGVYKEAGTKGGDGYIKISYVGME